MGRWGDREIGRWGDGEQEYSLILVLAILPLHPLLELLIGNRDLIMAM
ncbi:MAG: hypothetical protein F6K50_27180 [Moorea sp. SIO3I7]|nr:MULTISPECIES: hypothetical protein [unclassified Moorena]NEN99039.1 hypothetical protein [Moorena sp. SIO3I7]NEO14838.1 hypothetical protein [Moorena sp. SIO3E8]NEO61476.1 hypothetical protein [Moorena sp. SIO4G2]NEQ01269.1 hypothetical protein [Moorena sp. SIO3F7]